MDILYNVVAIRMNIIRSHLKHHNGNLIGFSSKQVPIKGIMRLKVTLGTWHVVINMDIDFLIVNALNNMYNAILGRASLNKANVIISKPHLLIRFLIFNGISQVRVYQVATRRCYMASL